MERGEVEALLGALYARREANDIEGAMAFFTPKSTYRVAGHPAVVPMARSNRGDELKLAFGQMCSLFCATKFIQRQLLIEGSRALAVVEASFVFTPTGETVTTELVHLWSFADGKVESVEEFLDTAYIMNLMSRAPAAPPG